MVGGKIVEYGQADAFGHKKLGGIGAITGDAIQKLTGSNIIYQQVAYLMRSGEPDALDRMVAISYAILATDLISQGHYGMLVALREGKYTVVPLETITQGKKVVDVQELYDSDQYRPKVANMLHKPMFLY
jgi:6-phosphofructokinase 1